MLNDRSSILSLLETRRSGKPRELVGPGPTPAELDRILAIAARVPDHGKLTPWRFIVIGDDQRVALARLLHQALAAEDPDVREAHLRLQRAYLERACVGDRPETEEQPIIRAY